MKRLSLILLILSFLVIVFNGCATIPSGYKPMTNKEGEQLYIVQDKFNDVSFIRHKYFFGIFAKTPIEIYEIENRALRIVFKYVGSDWIFFTKAIILGSQGDKIEFNFKSYDKKTDVDKNVYESIDLLLTDSEVNKILSILSESGIKKVRLSGKYYKDYELNNNKVVALIEIIKHYLKNK
ncbi:MAG: hypothetical protein JXR69_06970 [Candidatus Delongbacteria bacterium]|nr:hypothetical protein [Candidatus Delongbacteria bacterium]